MASTQQPNYIKTTIDQVLTPCGFRRRSSRWYRTFQELVQLVSLHKSNYGFLYYVDIGFFFLDLAATDAPQLHDCHLCLRLEELFPERLGDIRYFLNSSNMEERRFGESLTALINLALPLLDRWRTIRDIRNEIHVWPIAAANVKLPARVLLGLSEAM